MKPRRQLNLTGLRVLDGGMATELEAAGCDISGPLWSGHVLREHPEQVEAVHLAYLEAGADCISTASYQVSREAFRAAGLPEDDAAPTLQLAVEIAERACTRYHQKHRRPIWLAASLGPYGAALHNGAEYTGVYHIDHAALIAFHQRRIRAVASTNADFLLFETVPSLDEARAIVTALAGVPDIAAAISFTCRDERHTAHGEAIALCAQELDAVPQVVAIGINCLAPSLVVPIVRTLRQVTTKKIMAYPNSGELWDAERRQWTGQSSVPAGQDGWRALARQWRAAGADWIGGCCRTGPGHIRTVRTVMAS
jgi:homocysteine S-methyltransferase